MTSDHPQGQSAPPLLRDAFTLRRRPTHEKLIDGGFRQLTQALAALVAILLLAIVLTIVHGAREAMGQFGLRFLTTSAWSRRRWLPAVP